MVKDDYDVILCKLLIYLYAIMKRKTVYSDVEFDKTVRKNVNKDYFTDVLRLAQEEGLIRGVLRVERYTKTGASFNFGRDKDSYEAMTYFLNIDKEKPSGQR